MEIEPIIYDTTREVLNVEDKLRIATVFIFCDKLGSEKLSQLLYAKNHASFIQELNSEYKAYEVDFTINFDNRNVKNAFFKTLENVKEKYDSDGFLKAISEGDEFALAIINILKISATAYHIPDIRKSISCWGNALTDNLSGT
jgi:hypothetical protein